jgi:hypothetical protein
MAKNPEPQAAGKNFRVLHTQLGAWPKGHVISESDLPHPMPARNADGEPNPPEARAAARQENLNRLLQMGALEPVDEPRTGPAPAEHPDSRVAAQMAKDDGPKPIAPPQATAQVASKPVAPK